MSCYSSRDKLSYSQLKIEGKRSNQLIVDRIPIYGNGHKDGCIVERQMSIDISQLSNDSIIGTIFDSQTKQPVYFSTLYLISNKNAIPDTLSLFVNEKGEFAASLEQFPAQITAQFIGHRTLGIDLSNYKK